MAILTEYIDAPKERRASFVYRLVQFIDMSSARFLFPQKKYFIWIGYLISFTVIIASY